MTKPKSKTKPKLTADRKGWIGLVRAMQEDIKRRDYSPKTSTGYVGWVRKFGEYTKHMPIADISDKAAKGFLADLAENGGMATTSQNQAFNALQFLFRHVLKRDYELGDRVARAKGGKYIPPVLTRTEVDAFIGCLRYPYKLIVSMLYGCGLRLSECLELRVGDLDFEGDMVIVRDGKGDKERSLPMPKKLKKELKKQVARVAEQLEWDLETLDFGGVFMPESLGKRRALREAKELQWQWLFPAKELTLVVDEGLYRRYHHYRQQLTRPMRVAAEKAKINKVVTAHVFRHSFASHLLAADVDVGILQKLLGHSDIRTTKIYARTVKRQTTKRMISPLDFEE